MDGLIAIGQAKSADKILSQEITNLKNIGRFLSMWNCTTGLPTTNPTTTPYTYKTGDYYRVSEVATGSGTNYKPDGTSYTGAASTTAETESVQVTDIYYFDGTTWVLQKAGGAGLVQDVQVNGTSILSDGVANIPKASPANLGVVRIAANYGIDYTNGGDLKVNSANDALISAKSDTFRPLVSASVDKAVAVGITTNTITLSSAEKTAAHQWLGEESLVFTLDDDTTTTMYFVAR